MLKLRTGDADNDGKNDLALITGYTQYTDSEVNVYVVKCCDKKSTNIRKHAEKALLGSAILIDGNSDAEGNQLVWNVIPVYTKASPGRNLSTWRLPILTIMVK